MPKNDAQALREKVGAAIRSRLEDYADQPPEGVAPEEPGAETIDTNTGAAFQGTSLEPDETTRIDPQDGEVNDVLGRTDSSEPIPGEETKDYHENNQRGEPKNYGKNQRDQIYKNAVEQRDGEVAEGVEQMEAGSLADRMEMEASGGQPRAPEQPAGQDAQNPLEAAQRAEAEAAGGSDGGMTPTELVGDIDMENTRLTIRVDGEDQFATIAELVEAGGVESLQKERAAQKRLEQAATERRGLETEKRNLARQKTQLIAAIRKQVASGKEVPTSGGVPNADRQATSDGTDVEAVAKEIADDMYQGNSEEGAQKLLSLIRAETRRNGQASGTSKAREDELVSQRLKELGVDPSESAAAPGSQGEISLAQQRQANYVYNANFADVVRAGKADPRINAAAQRKMAALLEAPENRGRPVDELVFEAGNAIRQNYLVPDGTKVIPADELREILSRKRRLPPGARSQPAQYGVGGDAPEEVDRSQATANAFARIKAARGQ
jgi:hypothetical protein